MLLTRIPPTVAELVARALTATPFTSEATGANPHDLRIGAELCAGLAAESWEADRGALIGLSIPPELITEVADALEAHGKTVRDASDNALYAADAKLQRSLACLSTARSSIKGSLPIAAAEALLTEVETHFDHIRIAVTRALAILEVEIDKIEWAASRQRREAV